MTLKEAIARYIGACRDHDTATAHEYYETICTIRHREETPVSDHERLLHEVRQLDAA